MAGIYVHIPFCKSKCVYCAFYSVVLHNEEKSCHKQTYSSNELTNRYIQALTKEFSLHKDKYKDLNFTTLYFGGGTPSILEPSELRHIINSIKNNYNTANITESTIEANPEQLSQNYCIQLKELGFNRISIGVQSFNNNILKFLGRRHSSTDAVTAIHNAQKAGFENISIDLIYGINERNDSLWKGDLEYIKTLNINHFSAYALTLEENSILYKKVKANKHDALDEEMAKRQYDILNDFSEKNGYLHYEVSNFTKSGFKSNHNSSYWYGQPYAGFGVSAHSFNGNRRSWNAPDLQNYFAEIDKNIDCNGFEDLSANDKFNEYVLLRLRTSEGIDLFEMETIFGTKKIEYLQGRFNDVIDRKFYESDGSKIRLTHEGFWFADGIAADLFITD